ncbi:MAG: hypothetical protein HC809_11045 [Gammaproteobacteria bacterium]|nr:hypothetical protein [Gammaproteobacteria bacterium]
MDVFTMVVIVTAIGCAVPLVKTWIERGRNDTVAEHTVDALEREITSLRKRVEVLEEIATDQKHQLRREIAALDD